MQALTKAGLVLARRDGNWVRYRINPDLNDEIAGVLDAVMRATPALPAARIGCMA